LYSTLQRGHDRSTATRLRWTLNKRPRRHKPSLVPQTRPRVSTATVVAPHHHLSDQITSDRGDWPPPLHHPGNRPVPRRFVPRRQSVLAKQPAQPRSDWAGPPARPEPLPSLPSPPRHPPFLIRAFSLMHLGHTIFGTGFFSRTTPHRSFERKEGPRDLASERAPAAKRDALAAPEPLFSHPQRTREGGSTEKGGRAWWTAGRGGQLVFAVVRMAWRGGRGRLVLVDLPDSWAFSRSVCWDCGSDRFPFGRRGAWTLLFFCSRPLSGSSGWVDTTDARDQRLFVSTPRFHFSLDSDKPRKDLSEMANGDLPLFTNCQPASDGRPPAKD
jgi:hypothetical protein